MGWGPDGGRRGEESLSPRLEGTPSVSGEAGEIGPVQSTGELAVKQEQEGSKRKEMASSAEKGHAAESSEHKN